MQCKRDNTRLICASRSSCFSGCCWSIARGLQTICSSSDLEFISHSAVSDPILIMNRSPASCICRHYYELISVQSCFRLLSRCPHYWLNFRARQAACVWRMGEGLGERAFILKLLLTSCASLCALCWLCCASGL